MNGHIEKNTRWLANIPGTVRRILSGLYLALITLMSLLPSATFKTVPTLFENEDKAIHFLMYGGMSAMLCWSFPKRDRKQLLYYAAIILFCAGYGILMEILQGVLNQLDRSFSWADMTANLAGAICFIPVKEKLIPRKLDKIEQ